MRHGADMANYADLEVIELLAGAAGAGQALDIELRDGRRFLDGVCDVRRNCGEDVVIFHANNRVAIRDIVRARPSAVADDSTCSAA